MAERWIGSSRRELLAHAVVLNDLDTGVNIQPWVFDQASLADPVHYRAPHVVRTVRREGVRL